MGTPFDPIAAARRSVVARVPLHVGAGSATDERGSAAGTAAGERGSPVGAPVGSVARAHLGALRRWPHWLEVTDGAVTLVAPRPQRDEALAIVNAALRDLGLVRAWRDEVFALFDPPSGRALARIERASARFWGTLTLGAHATGFVRDARGVVTGLWIAQRSPLKATDPGLFDNLVGGGVPVGQSPTDALVREGLEEAGLDPSEMAGARPAGVLRLARDVAEGFQFEWLHAFDLELPVGRTPLNQDGEVAGFTLRAPAEAAALALSRTMTVDAALVTLDFLLRHRLLDDARLAVGLDSLRVRFSWAG